MLDEIRDLYNSQGSGKIFIILGLIASFASGLVIASLGQEAAKFLVLSFTGAVVGFTILLKPHWGIYIMCASFPLQTLLPPIPLLSSVNALFGMVTLGAYILKERSIKVKITRPASQYVWALCFIAWVVVSNPGAAFLGGRVWAWTYIQLLLLMWLTAQLLTPERHKSLFQFYILACLVSAVLAIAQARIGSSLYNTVRGEGLAGNQNELAMYLVIGVAAWLYLYMGRGTTRISGGGLLHLILLGILVMGIIASVSRTGFIALVIILTLFVILNRGDAVRSNQKRRISRYVLPAILLAVILAFFVPKGYWQILEETKELVMATMRRESLFFIRLIYWENAIRMWLEHPIRGVGIDQFRYLYPNYAPAGAPIRFTVAHNSFLSILTETGIIGFFFFINWFTAIVRGTWTALSGETAHRQLALSWLLILVVIFIFMLANNFEYFKILWITAGVSIVLQGYAYPDERVEAGAA